MLTLWYPSRVWLESNSRNIREGRKSKGKRTITWGSLADNSRRSWSLCVLLPLGFKIQAKAGQAESAQSARGPQRVWSVKWAGSAVFLETTSSCRVEQASQEHTFPHSLTAFPVLWTVSQEFHWENSGKPILQQAVWKTRSGLPVGSGSGALWALFSWLRSNYSEGAAMPRRRVLYNLGLAGPDPSPNDCQKLLVQSQIWNGETKGLKPEGQKGSGVIASCRGRPTVWNSWGSWFRFHFSWVTRTLSHPQPPDWGGCRSHRVHGWSLPEWDSLSWRRVEGSRGHLYGCGEPPACPISASWDTEMLHPLFPLHPRFQIVSHLQQRPRKCMLIADIQ